jgi:hypothetical protein
MSAFCNKPLLVNWPETPPDPTNTVGSVHPRLSHDLGSLPAVLESTRSFAEQVLAGLDERSVAHGPAGLEPDPLPTDGVGFDGALARFAERWEPGFSGSAGPRYLGFVTGGATPASIAGDWLTSAFDQNAVAGDSSAVDLERETVRWLRELGDLADVRVRGDGLDGGGDVAPEGHVGQAAVVVHGQPAPDEGRVRGGAGRVPQDPAARAVLRLRAQVTVH